MKKILLLIVGSLLLWGQQLNANNRIAKKILELKRLQTSFYEINLFQNASNVAELSTELSKTVAKFNVLDFNTGMAQSALILQPEYIKFSIPQGILNFQFLRAMAHPWC